MRSRASHRGHSAGSTSSGLSIGNRTAPNVRQHRQGGRRLSPAVVLLVSGVLLLAPLGGARGGQRAAAATPATTTTALNLRGGPSTGQPVLTVMPAGSAVSVDGAPQAGFYPVTYGGLSGWAFGAYLSIAGGGPGPAPAPPSGGGAVTTTALNLRAGPSTADAVLQVMPAGAPVTLTGQSANGFSSVSYNGTAGWAFAAYLAGAGGSPAPPPAPTPNPPPAAPSPGPTGTATATTNVNLRAGPSTADAVLFLIPAGGSVQLRGETRNGYAAVTYQGISGWAFAAYLGTAPPPTQEPPPPQTPGGGPVPTPAPGSGTAYATAAVNLRQGPSASTAVLAVVPAGTAVTLTGVAENGFYRVVYAGQTGWVSATYLNLGGGAPGGGGSGSGGGKTYTREQIVQIIYAAADRYKQPREAMLRVAQCESNLNPNAVNPSGSYGLYQFIRSTWQTTPYASYDIFDPWANANAAAWMWSVGRRNEWICQ